MNNKRGLFGLSPVIIITAASAVVIMAVILTIWTVNNYNAMNVNSVNIERCLKNNGILNVNGLSNPATTLTQAQPASNQIDLSLGCLKYCTRSDVFSVLTQCYADIAIKSNNPLVCDRSNDPRTCHAIFSGKEKM